MTFDVYRAPDGAFARCEAEARRQKNEWLFFCGEDAAPDEALFARLTREIEACGAEYAALEPRTLPYENGKYYDPVTRETECLGTCFAVRRDAFLQAGGFHGAGAAALSARLRAGGFRLRYVPDAVLWESPAGADGRNVPSDAGEAGVFVRAGGGYAHTPPAGGPAFTAVIRTYQRPDVLRLTLESLRWQTWRAFSVVVVEDGEVPVSEAAAQEAKAWLDLTYVAAHARWGRCRAGNEGVARAKTEYVCFLDDDDYLFAEHFEVMARAIEDRPDCGLWCARAVEGRCRQGVRADFLLRRNQGKDDLCAADFCVENPVPIQAVVFRKSLYEACGGLDPTMDALEDWDLWLRMVSRAPVAGVPKATSIYRVPYETERFERRRAAIEAYRGRLLEKMQGYTLPLCARDVYALCGGEKADRPAPLDYAAWYEKARALHDSTCWRLTAPLRRLLAALGRGAGPAAPDWNSADAGTLYRYCMEIERSFFWRLLAPLRRR